MKRADVGQLLPNIVRLAAALLLTIQTSSGQSGDRIVHLDHADSLIGREIDGEKVRELIGNVRFSQGDVLVNCHRAIQYMSSEKILLEGEVAVRDDSLTLFADRGVYHGRDKMAEAFDRVRLDDGSTLLSARYGRYYTESRKAFFKDDVVARDTASVLKSDELTYDRSGQTLVADGNVSIVNPSNSITIEGGHFEHEKQRGFSRMTIHPRSIQRDTSEGGIVDSLVVTSVVMESYDDSSRRLIAVDSTVLVRGDFAAACGMAVFLTRLDSIELRRSPFVWYASAPGETTQVSGDSMFVRLVDRKIETLHVFGNAVAISQADTSNSKRYHQLTGQTLRLHFHENQIREIEVNSTATMLYYLFDEGRPNGINTTTGDYVSMTFAEKKMQKIKVVGGVEGKYVPERLLMGREEEYNLAGFNWKQDRPRNR